MKSARRKKFTKRWRSAHTPSKKTHIYGIFIKILVPLAIILMAFLFVKIRTIYWNGYDKVAFTYRMDGGDVGVTIADTKLEELTTLIIPGDTEVDVAENYGTLRLKNVWQLSQNEKLKGRLLPETVTQNFLFPVHLWADVGAVSLIDQSIMGTVKFVFSPSVTNIPFGDRVSLAMFALRASSLGRSEINLGESQFLKKQKLNDGEIGYILNGPISQRLTVYFSDNDLSVTASKINIVDATGTPDVAIKVGEIIEVMGGKVVSVEKKGEESSDCEVSGKDKAIVKKVITLFSCKSGIVKSDFDLEIRLGQNFAKRF